MDSTFVDSTPPGTVVVDDVWESFRSYTDNPQGLKDRLVGRRKKVAKEFWALRGVSFELEPGDTMALIGANGSGKSTLLKCLARILVPSRGEIRTVGRTSAMLELGAGFHGDLSGRENVYLNASILGFRHAQVEKVFDDIVEFAELADFIDAPVRTYSSGMYLRLGFAVAIHLDPDILLIDEVLAVGDARFVARCFERIRALKKAGVTIIVVTHDLETAGNLCDRAVYLERGEVKMAGTGREVVDHYRADVAASQAGRAALWEGGEVYGTGEMTVDEIELKREGRGAALAVGEPFSVQFRVRANVDVEDPVFGAIVRAGDGTYLYGTNTLWQRVASGSIKAGEERVVRFDLDGALLPGRYLVTVAASRSDSHVHYDWHTDALAFEVAGPMLANGFVELAGKIDLTTPAEPDSPPLLMPLDPSAESHYYRARAFDPDHVLQVRRHFLPFISGREFFVDLGCGRGEFLGMAAEVTGTVKGVDIDPEMAATARAVGFTVAESGALEYLQTTTDRPDAVLAAHLVEHLPVAGAYDLLTALAAVMAPGGVVILVTPNPACLAMLTQDFWSDPTHVRPYTLELLSFLLGEAGFRVTEAGGNPLDVPGPPPQLLAASTLEPWGTLADTLEAAPGRGHGGLARLGEEVAQLRHVVSQLDARLFELRHQTLHLHDRHNEMLEFLYPANEIYVIGERAS